MKEQRRTENEDIAKEMGISSKMIPKSKKGAEMMEDFFEEQRYKHVEDQFSDDEATKGEGGRYYDAKYAEFAHVSQVTLPIDRIPEDIL